MLIVYRRLEDGELFIKIGETKSGVEYVRINSGKKLEIESAEANFFDSRFVESHWPEKIALALIDNYAKHFGMSEDFKEALDEVRS